MNNPLGALIGFVGVMIFMPFACDKPKPKTIGSECHVIHHTVIPNSGIEADFDSYYFKDRHFTASQKENLESYCAQVIETTNAQGRDGKKYAKAWYTLIIYSNEETFFQTQKEAFDFVNNHEYKSRHTE